MASEILTAMKACRTELIIAGVTFSVMKDRWSEFCAELNACSRRCRVTFLTLNFRSPKIAQWDIERIERFAQLIQALEPVGLCLVEFPLYSTFFLVDSHLFRFFHAHGQPTSATAMISTSHSDHIDSVKLEVKTLMGTKGSQQLNTEGVQKQKEYLLALLQQKKSDLGERKAKASSLSRDIALSILEFGDFPGEIKKDVLSLYSKEQGPFYVVGTFFLTDPYKEWILQQIAEGKSFFFFVPDPWKPFFYATYKDSQHLRSMFEAFFKPLASNQRVKICLQGEPISNQELIFSESIISLESKYPGFDLDLSALGYYYNPDKVKERKFELDSLASRSLVARREFATILRKTYPPILPKYRELAIDYAERVSDYCSKIFPEALAGSGTFVPSHWHDNSPSLMLAVNAPRFQEAHRFISETFPGIVIQLVASKFEDRYASGDSIQTTEHVATLGYCMESNEQGYAVSSAHLLLPHNPLEMIMTDQGQGMGTVNAMNHHYSPPATGTPQAPTKDHMFVSLGLLSKKGQEVQLAHGDEIKQPGNFFDSFIVFTRDGNFNLAKGQVQYASTPHNLDRHYRHILNVHCAALSTQNIHFAEPGQSGSVMIGITRFPDGSEEHAILGILKFEYLDDQLGSLSPRVAGFIPIDTIRSDLVHTGGVAYLMADN